MALPLIDHIPWKGQLWQTKLWINGCKNKQIIQNRAKSCTVLTLLPPTLLVRPDHHHHLPQSGNYGQWSGGTHPGVDPGFPWEGAPTLQCGGGVPAYNFYQVFQKITVLYKASSLFNCIVVTHTQIHTHSRSNKIRLDYMKLRKFWSIVGFQEHPLRSATDILLDVSWIILAYTIDFMQFSGEFDKFVWWHLIPPWTYSHQCKE